MTTISYSMEVPKEFKELVDALDALGKKIKAKAPITEYSVLIPTIMAAADGVEQIKDEVGGEFRDEAAAYLVHKLMGRFMPIKPVVDEPVV